VAKAEKFWFGDRERTTKRGAYILWLEALLVIPVQGTVTEDLAIGEHELELVLSDERGPNGN